MPESDEDWAKLRHSAVGLAEATNLLVISGREVDAAGVQFTSEYELGPEQIHVLVESNWPAWVAHAAVLHEAAKQAISMIDNRNDDGLNDVGEAIDAACESCHLQFWYPEDQ